MKVNHTCANTCKVFLSISTSVEWISECFMTLGQMGQEIKMFDTPVEKMAVVVFMLLRFTMAMVIKSFAIVVMNTFVIGFIVPLHILYYGGNKARQAILLTSNLIIKLGKFVWSLGDVISKFGDKIGLGFILRRFGALFMKIGKGIVIVGKGIVTCLRRLLRALMDIPEWLLKMIEKYTPQDDD